MLVTDVRPGGAAGTGPVSGAVHAPPRRPALRPPGGPALSGQLLRFAGVGVVSTVVHLGLYLALARMLGLPQAANLLALLVATVANTALNRRWTFGISGAASAAARQHAQALLVFGLTWGGSSLGVAGVHALLADPHPLAQAVFLGGGMAVATVVRFVAMRRWIFRAAPAEA